MVKAVCLFMGNSTITGAVHFEQEGSGPDTVTGELTGLGDGLNGFRVHQVGKCHVMSTSQVTISPLVW